MNLYSIIVVIMVTFVYIIYMNYKLTYEQKYQGYLEACELRKQGLNNKTLIEKTIFPTWRVLEFFMAMNNLSLPKQTKWFRIHESPDDYFKVIDTPEKAYILGFTYADGCVYDNNRFGYCLSKKDECIIDYISNNICPSCFKKEVHNTKGAKNRQPQILLRITNYNIINDLRSIWGVNINKTINTGLVFPNLPEDLMWSFILGICDGDGNIFMDYYKEGNTFRFRICICMTDKIFLETLQNFLLDRGLKFSVYELQGKTCKYYKLVNKDRMSGVVFCNNMYKNPQFCLERKKEKYNNIINALKLDNTVLTLEDNISKAV